MRVLGLEFPNGFVIANEKVETINSKKRANTFELFFISLNIGEIKMLFMLLRRRDNWIGCMVPNNFSEPLELRENRGIEFNNSQF